VFVIWRAASIAFPLLVFILTPVCLPAPAPQKAPVPEGYRNTSPGVAYVGSKVCASCHPKIYESYKKTDMGRSMAVAGSELDAIPPGTTIRNDRLNRSYAVSRESDGLYQSEFELDSSGGEVFRATHKLEYVIGSGANAITFLVRRGNYLFEAPLTYYFRIQNWSLSPGYERDDAGFSRTIPAACVVCHSGQPRPISRSRGLFLNPPFRELAIGCENCHGPGQLHVAERGRSSRVSGKVDWSIVNPARLQPWLADNICMNCHQGTATRVLQPGKEFTDFRPGTPLNDTVAIFAPPLKPGDSEHAPLLEHHKLMTLSKCYRATNGKMSCLTCHDPHVQPRNDSAAYFRGKCLGCHAETDCKLPRDGRLASTPANDCAGCHMPKEPTSIPHSVLTNHRIIATPDQPLPDEAFHQTGTDSLELIHLNTVPGKDDVIPPLTLLRAYGEMAVADRQYGPLYLEAVDRAAQADPESPSVLSALGWREVGRYGTEAKTREYLSRAIQNGSSAPLDFEKLGELLHKDGKTPEAIAILQQGIHDNPYSKRLYQSLAMVYLAEKQNDAALAVMRRELELFPEDSTMRAMIQKVVAAR